MCGIVGRINFDSEKVDRDLLQKAKQLLHLRGPDDSGTWIEKNVGLGHQRLSIIDLSPTGHQPMESHNQRYICVFNGEIYNFQDVREQLPLPDNYWNGHSDTEVLLEAYATWGVKCLDRLDGMFAFAIWDRKKEELFAARDRMGEKPFYYHCNSKQFGFASRPRPLFSVFPGLSPEYDEQAIRLYLESGYIPAAYSAHKQIRKLPAAHYLLASKGGIKIERYWDFQSICPESDWRKRPENDLLDELDEILSRNIKKRMISDVPLGAFLSGGIDSSLVVAIMRRHSNSSIKTFTIGFEEKEYDESPDAQNIASHLETDHLCQFLQVKDLLKLVPDFLEQYDEPFFDSSAFPTMAVSRLAKQHVAVSLTGDGGDELFGGYHYYKIARFLNMFYHLPGSLRKGLGKMTGSLPGHYFKLLGEALCQESSSRAFSFSRSIAKDFRGILPESVLCRTIGLGDVFENTVKNFSNNLHASEEGMRLDAMYTLCDDYLQKTDVASMSFSLETRAPLLSREVIEWSMKLPVQYKVKYAANKYLLRQLVYRFIPKSIMDRPKRGFGVPIDSWLRGPLAEWAENHFLDKEYFKGLPLDQPRVLELFKLHKSGFRNVHPLLWAILMLLEFNSRVQTGAFTR